MGEGAENGKEKVGREALWKENTWEAQSTLHDTTTMYFG